MHNYNGELYHGAKVSLMQLQVDLDKLKEAKGKLPEKLVKQYTKLIKSLVTIHDDTENMLNELEKRYTLALQNNFYNYSIKVTMVLSNGKKPTLETSLRTEIPNYDIQAFIKNRVEELVKEHTSHPISNDDTFKDATLVSYTSDIKKSGKKN